MGWPQCNTTLEDERITETKLFDSHDFTFHKLIIAVSAVTGLIAIVVSLFLMFMHATHYSRPKEQRHIIRILFMVPVYALVSFLSIIYYYHSVYYEVLRDCYEAFAIASFFTLMCSFLADDLHEQKEYFRKIKPKPWIWPMRWFQKCCGGDRGCLRTPRSGLTWFNVIWVAVFQYCFIRVTMTITAVITQYFDRYCLESLNPAFAHVWVMVVEAIAVTITMYCIIQFYVQIRSDVAQHKPILKVLAIKLVIFLSFWQTILISFLTSSGAIKSSAKIQTPDIKVGIPCMLLCIEMALFAFFHLWSFTYKPYVIGSARYEQVYGHVKNKPGEPRYYGGPFGIKAIGQCFNPWDIIKAVGRSGKWLFRDRKHRMNDASYTTVTTDHIESQKLSNLDAAPTAYAGAAGGQPLKRTGTEEDTGLLAGAQGPAQAKPFGNHLSDDSAASSWKEVEAKEYYQEEQRGRTGRPQDGFEPAQTNAYDTRYYQTGNQYQQQTGVLRPAGTGVDQRIPAQQQNLPFVTRQDIENMQHTRQGQLPYPRSFASARDNR